MFIHAHPDDEALLTGGTIARLGEEGHRTVLVTATDGAAGLAAAASLGGRALSAVRAAELEKSARALGVARLEMLGYPDSGLHGDVAPGAGGPSGGRAPFAAMDVDTVAARVAEVLESESADVVVGYDAAGGYGHPDHVQVHRVARRAAQLAGTPVLLEATVPREPMARVVRIGYCMRWLVPQLGGLDPEQWDRAFTPRQEITHIIDVRKHLGAKRAALAAHVSQAGADTGPRTLAALVRLPRWLFAKTLGTEWFVGQQPGRFDHPLATLPPAGPAL